MFASLKIFWNGLITALQELRVNKLRTFLSLLGITIGIFCIIAVFTLTSSLENNIRSEVKSLGSDVVYIQKWPWGGGGDFPWWKYVNRPDPDYEDFRALQQRTTAASSMAFLFSGNGKKVQYGDDYMDGVGMTAVTQEFNNIQQVDIEAGRYFSPTEFNGYHPVIILGANISSGLFGSAEQAIGKEVEMGGRPFTVIGATRLKGSSMMDNFNFDDGVIVTYMAGRQIANERSGGPLIMAQAKPGVSVMQLKDELRGNMRAIHRLKPTEEDNFSLNELSMISDDMNKMFGKITFGGFCIGIFSLIVGAFGIANIMFVIVKERTPFIGLKKAIGAKRSVILLEFLIESMMLCIIGGLIGMSLVFLIVFIVAHATTFHIYMSLGIIISGLSISAITGILAGIIPAYSAAKLDPVVAIRST